MHQDQGSEAFYAFGFLFRFLPEQNPAKAGMSQGLEKYTNCVFVAITPFIYEIYLINIYNN